ncbi:MAG: PEGA domain-containing protein [Myxococcota bacterium]
MNRTLVPAAVCALVSFASLAQTEEAAAKKLAVIPFAALSGDVPQRAGLKAAGMLSTELKNTDGVQVVAAHKPAAGDPFAPGLEKARKLLGEAQAHRAKRKFRLAEEALTQALAELKTAGLGLTDIGELVDVYALLSAVQFNTGRDEEGRQSLATALALAPTRELPLAKTSALFTKVVEDERRRVQTSAKGSLLVESTPQGAMVTVDGVPLGATPLQVKEVPAGQHLWKVSLPSGEVLGGMVEVAGAKQAKVSAQTAAKDPESKILATLAQNKLDAEVVAAARDHAGAAQAELLLFGALSKEGKGLALDAFLFSAHSGEVRRLPRSTFDTELLSAGMEFYALAGKLALQGGKVGEAVKVPSPVSLSTVASTAKVAEAKYGVQPGKDLAADIEAPIEPVKDVGPRTPLAPAKRTPLKKK